MLMTALNILVITALCVEMCLLLTRDRNDV